MKKICKVTNSALVSGALLLSLIGITPVHALETGDEFLIKKCIKLRFIRFRSTR